MAMMVKTLSLFLHSRVHRDIKRNYTGRLFRGVNPWWAITSPQIQEVDPVWYEALAPTATALIDRSSSGQDRKLPSLNMKF